MTRKFLLTIVATLMSLCAMAQSEFYVVMKDGSVQSYPSEKVDSLTFKNPEVSTIMGFGDMMKLIDNLKSKVDSLEGVVSNCCKSNDIVSSTPIDTVSSTPIDTIPNTTHAYIDLGLPSGTLWTAYNVGASAPEEYGDYFAWGETEVYDGTQTTSRWFYVPYDSLMANGVIDSIGNLTVKYDAAAANWGNDWRMPTRKEIEELIFLKNEYVEVNGVKGRKFIGTNGNTLFLPFVGYRYEDELYRAGGAGYYWSAPAYRDDLYAYSLLMVSENV